MPPMQRKMPLVKTDFSVKLILLTNLILTFIKSVLNLLDGNKYKNTLHLWLYCSKCLPFNRFCFVLPYNVAYAILSALSSASHIVLALRFQELVS